MFIQRIAIVAALAVAPLAAVAAIPEPTEAEIRTLTERDIVRANEPVIDYHRRLDKGNIPDDMLIRLNGLKKLDCTPVDQQNAHDCKIEMDLTVPQGGRRTRTMMIRFTKTEEGWKGGRPEAPQQP